MILLNDYLFSASISFFIFHLSPIQFVIYSVKSPFKFPLPLLSETTYLIK